MDKNIYNLKFGDRVRVIELIRKKGSNTVTKETIKQGFVSEVTDTGVKVVDPEKPEELSWVGFAEWFPFSSKFLKVELMGRNKRTRMRFSPS